MMKCLILEDELPAMELLKEYLQKIPFIKVVGTCFDAFEAQEFLSKNKVDLLFSDIEMPVLTGLQFLRTLTNPPLVIFTTAYQQHALEGYELDVVDYLLKPYNFERLLKAVNKAHTRWQRADIDPDKTKKDTGSLFVYSEYKEIKISYSQILYIQGLKDYVKIYIMGREKPILTRHNIKAILEKLPNDLFMRIHNSYIIALDKITSFQKTKIYINELILPLGQSYSQEFLEKFKK